MKKDNQRTLLKLAVWETSIEMATGYLNLCIKCCFVKLRTFTAKLRLRKDCCRLCVKTAQTLTGNTHLAICIKSILRRKVSIVRIDYHEARVLNFPNTLLTLRDML